MLRGMFRSLTTLGLFTLLLADVAPAGSCGGKGPSGPTTLVFSVADCSCLPATLRVDVSGQAPQDIVLACGQTASAIVEPGPVRRVTVTQGSIVWYESAYRGTSDRVSVSMTCPRR
jgi:hypothetical protein